MSIKYKVLWIDDNIEAAEAKAEGITDFLGEEGFDFIPLFKENGVGIEEILNDPELDIVITDFNLDGIDVQELINLVRKQQKYIEIVLYSEHPPHNFQEVAKSHDGIYATTRQDVEDCIMGVIENTIRRTQNVNNMRGIVISEGIDIENQIEEIIISYFGNDGDLAKKVIEKEGVCDFGKKIEFLNSILKKIVKQYNKSISQLAGDEKTALSLKRDFVKPLYNTTKLLANEVMKPRNMLAHVDQKLDNDNIPYLKSIQKGYDDIVANSEWYKITRKDLQKHSNNLNKILVFMNNQLNS